MKRRKFIRSALAAGSLLYIGRGARADPPRDLPIVLRLGMSNSGLSACGKLAVGFSQFVAEKSAGRLKIDVYPNNEAGGEMNTALDLMSGAIDMVATSSVGYACPRIAPQLGVFDVPFLFRDVQHARSVLDGPIGQAALKELYPAGIVGLAWGENGLRHITTSNKPVRSPRDLAGLRIRVPQSEVMVTGFKALGADPSPFPYQDLYAALAQGSFQAQENPLANIRTASFDQVQKYLCLTGHVYSPAALLIGRRVLEKLSAADQEIIRAASQEAAKASRSTSDETQHSDLDHLRRRGMTIIEDIDRNAFVTEITKASAEFERVFDKKRLAAIREWGA